MSQCFYERGVIHSAELLEPQQQIMKIILVDDFFTQLLFGPETDTSFLLHNV